MQYNAANKSLTELDEGFLSVTAHFNNMRTLKFKSHCCVFPDNKPGKTETQKKLHIKNYHLLNSYIK